MITTDEAAALSGTTRVTMNTWIKAGRCIGASHLRRGHKLPRWQFEPFTFPVIAPVTYALGSSDGWQLLAFLGSPHPALDGQSHRTALEQGTPSVLICDARPSSTTLAATPTLIPNALPFWAVAPRRKNWRS